MMYYFLLFCRYNYKKCPGHYGYLVLAKPIFQITYLENNTICKILQSVCYKCSSILLNKDEYSSKLPKKNKARFARFFNIVSKNNKTCPNCEASQPKYKKVKKIGDVKLSFIEAKITYDDDKDDKTTAPGMLSEMLFESCGKSVARTP